MIPSSHWGLYQGVLGALASSQQVSLFFFAGAASALETRAGFETATGFLRTADWSQGEALRRRVVGFLERRDVAAALMPHIQNLARFAGVDPGTALPEALPERRAPWWFEARHPLKSGRGMVPIEDGALAMGDERALDWLLKVRDLVETGGCPPGFSASPHLIWIPERSAQATQLNRHGLVYRPEDETFETVNAPGRIRIRALFPYPLRLGREQRTVAMALTTFQHQYWSETPEGLEARLGADLMSRLPEKVLVHQHHFIHPQAILLPGFGQALAAQFGARFVFLQAGRVWLGRPTGEGVQDRTDEAPEEWIAYFRRLAGIETFHQRPPSEESVPEELPEGGPGQRVERMIAPTNEEGHVALDATQPLIPLDSAGNEPKGSE
ncbi:MAG TPA: hypothetical protein VLJ37_08335 [bacterium]|nr:hypothetical protein [bacterium]